MNITHSMRVLARPPPIPTPTPTPSRNGVVVVGFIGDRHDDVAHLINKLVDSNVFGSGNLDTPFIFEDDLEWFHKRKLSFYHHQEQGIVYLHFAAFDSDNDELGDLQGLLFMFSVCHIILLIQDGSRFDTLMLKKFRILQAAKHAMAPFLRSQNIPPVTSRPHASATSRISTPGASPNSPPPGKSRGILNRNGSAITLISGLGSYTSVFPGQCTPVILFVFIDDFTDIHPSGNAEEPSETSVNSSSSLNTSARQGLPVKGSGSVVVLARPLNKSDGGLRKKLQSSLEGQIRFSIKKCRTLSGSESSHAGSRTGAISNLAPLFSLDTSKVVSLVDSHLVQSGESLEFAISLIEEVLDGKATSDSLLLESHQQNANKEDIVSLKEFICRQSDMLRGKGGLAANANSGSGVGMVAVAAAAAAASTASRKTVTSPELPSLEIWSSSCQLILHGILCAAGKCTTETKINRVHEKNGFSLQRESTTSDSLESAIAHLESGIGMNTRFSTLWCQKAFPVAMEVYLDNLPSCYPSSQHEDQLRKACLAFTSMVKGPAVQLYLKKLKDQCTSIWNSGRQRCDAISLSGKPCMHRRHDDRTLSEDEIKTHSSGYVYLHACACGRSRKLRQDPFDYETANVAFNIFSDCDKLLPSVRFPEGSSKGPIQPSSWNLVRIGGARYYDPLKGLLQSGFCATQKFLLRWTIFLEKHSEANQSPLYDSHQFLLNSTTGADTVVDPDSKTSRSAWLSTGGIENGVGPQVRDSPDITQTNSQNMGLVRGLSNFSLRKPFSEVVAGPAASDSAFPPLFSRKHLPADNEKAVKLHQTKPRGLEKNCEIVYTQESIKVESIAPIDKALHHNVIADDRYGYGNAFPHIGSNTIPLNVNGNDQTLTADTVKHATIYLGFEHECSRGHRFILTQDHLNELGSSYAVFEDTTVPFSSDSSEQKLDPAKLGKTGSHGRTRRQSNGKMMGGGGGKAKHLEKLKEKVTNGNIIHNKPIQPTKQHKDQNERASANHSAKDLDSKLKSATVDDDDCAFSLLDRSLPIYMNCPHCRDSRTLNDTPNIEFASAISQLQRIFVVTPPFPIILAADPVIQFEVSCLPPSVPDREQKLQFNLDCPVILPPESFLSLRLPFVYGVELDGNEHSLKPLENQPHLTAWIVKGTSLQVVSKRSSHDVEIMS